jgi:hypothetical protein
MRACICICITSGVVGVHVQVYTCTRAYVHTFYTQWAAAGAVDLKERNGDSCYIVYTCAYICLHRHMHTYIHNGVKGKKVIYTYTYLHVHMHVYTHSGQQLGHSGQSHQGKKAGRA